MYPITTLHLNCIHLFSTNHINGIVQNLHITVSKHIYILVFTLYVNLEYHLNILPPKLAEQQYSIKKTIVFFVYFRDIR